MRTQHQAQLVIYGLSSPPGVEHRLDKLGKFKAGSAYVYVNKLADIDVVMLWELIRITYGRMAAPDIVPSSGTGNGQGPDPLREPGLGREAVAKD